MGGRRREGERDDRRPSSARRRGHAASRRAHNPSHTALDRTPSSCVRRAIFDNNTVVPFAVYTYSLRFFFTLFRRTRRFPPFYILFLFISVFFSSRNTRSFSSEFSRQTRANHHAFLFRRRTSKKNKYVPHSDHYYIPQCTNPIVTIPRRCNFYFSKTLTKYSTKIYFDHACRFKLQNLTITNTAVFQTIRVAIFSACPCKNVFVLVHCSINVFYTRRSAI